MNSIKIIDSNDGSARVVLATSTSGTLYAVLFRKERTVHLATMQTSTVVGLGRLSSTNISKIRDAIALIGWKPNRGATADVAKIANYLCSI